MIKIPFIDKFIDKIRYFSDYFMWGFQSDNIRKFDRIISLNRPEVRRIIIKNASTLEDYLRHKVN